MTPVQRVERFFGRLGTVCQIVGATFLLIVLGHYAIGGAVFVRNLLTTGEADKVDVRYASPVYDDFPDRVAYWKEFNKAWGEHFEPYYHWRRDAFDGEYINVDADGIRVTTGATPLPSAKRVFMLGGSTMWGTGAPDQQTIPSLFQSLLGEQYQVLNYGDKGYVSAQELNFLLFQLTRGNIPDIVIFYDGANDGYTGAYSPAVPRDPHALRIDARESDSVLLTLYENSNYSDLVEFLIKPVLNKLLGGTAATYAPWDAAVAPAIERNSRAVVEVYETHIRQVRALARDYGFKAFFFWQPTLFSLNRQHMTPFEVNEIESASPTLVASQRAVYEVAKRRLSNREDEGIFFLGDVFDEVGQPIYIDWHHVGPNGNEIIAREMFERLRDRL